jgi:hypothetical protein
MGAYASQAGLLYEPGSWALKAFLILFTKLAAMIEKKNVMHFQCFSSDFHMPGYGLHVCEWESSSQ